MKLQKQQRQRGVILHDKGWQRLQKAIRDSEIRHNCGDKYTFEELKGIEEVNLDSVTIARIMSREKRVDKRTLERFFRSFNLELDRADYFRPESDSETHEKQITPARITNTHQDWGEVVDGSNIYGRTEELTKLEQWILKERCRLITLSGLVGVGKTLLCAKLAKNIHSEFNYVIWRSLRFVQSPQKLLVSLIEFLSNQQVVETDLPKSLNGKILRLLKYLQSSRCLLVLDDVESILQDNIYAGSYQEDCEGYGEIFTRVGKSLHQSCLILTGRELPEEVISMEGKTLLIRSLRLSGLEEEEAKKLLRAKGLAGTELEKRQLIELYRGHPLALKIIATSIKEIFDGEIFEFLRQEVVVFNEFRKLLDQQFERLVNLEKQVMQWLAINNQPVSLSELHKNLVPTVSKSQLLETLESLLRRSLIEQNSARFMQQPIVMEYVTEQFTNSSPKSVRDRATGFEISALNTPITVQSQASEDLSPDDWQRNPPRCQSENCQRNLELVAQVKQIAVDKNCTLAQLVLAWLIVQDDQNAPITDTKSISIYSSMSAL